MAPSSDWGWVGCDRHCKQVLARAATAAGGTLGPFRQAPITRSSRVLPGVTPGLAVRDEAFDGAQDRSARICREAGQALRRRAALPR
jgi:hypothetical protein